LSFIVETLPRLVILLIAHRTGKKKKSLFLQSCPPRDNVEYFIYIEPVSQQLGITLSKLADQRIQVIVHYD